MTEREYEAKLAELDRLLNDPEVRLDPERVWTLLAEVSARDLGRTAPPGRAAATAGARAA